MSMVNADSVQLFAMLKKMQDSISSIETTKKSVKMKYEQLGAGWQDKKYNELGVVVRDCNKALNDILVIMLQAEKYVALLAKSLSEYESVQLGSTNGISASTPQTSSFAVTPSSADTTTFESNTFGSNLAWLIVEQPVQFCPLCRGVAVLVLNGNAVDGNSRAVRKLGFHPVGVHIVVARKQFVHSRVLHDLILMFGHSNQCRQAGGG